MSREIMTEFAKLTGLSPTGEVLRRYLWTDAFAVCNFLELYGQTSDEKYKHLALRLVDQVHHILGRHREDDPRTGWISGLAEREGKMFWLENANREAESWRAHRDINMVMLATSLAPDGYLTL